MRDPIKSAILTTAKKEERCLFVSFPPWPILHVNIGTFFPHFSWLPSPSLYPSHSRATHIDIGRVSQRSEMESALFIDRPCLIEVSAIDPLSCYRAEIKKYFIVKFGLGNAGTRTILHR